jgi:GntR family transcriptional regulator
VAAKQDGRPRHEQIAADIRAKIMSGDMIPGEQLPSTQQLVDLYGAANATIQRALTTLKDEGFLRSQVGKGVYVRDKQPFVVDVAAYFSPTPGGYTYRLLDVREDQSPNDIAQALGLSDNDIVILRRRILLHDGSPVELSSSYYPIDIAAGTLLANRAKIRGGAPRALADLGYPERELVDRLSVRPPTTDELQLLELPDNVPVIRQLRVIYSDNDRPVEASSLVKGGHLYELRYHQVIS